MKKILLIFLLQIIGFQLFAQNNVLRGKLIDSLSTEPLIYASVTLQSKNPTKFLKGDLSNDKGIFNLEIAPKNTYLVKIEYVGYKTKIIEITSDDNQSLDLGAISLSPLSQLLESVTVAGQKQTVVATLEKQVFKTSQFEVAKGGTASDVLRNIPSVTINAEGDISVRGSKGFLILVNGKPSQVDAVTLLAQIPANSIEKVEMITAPSAKYDADGKAGIINIVTKTGATDGISVTVNGQLGLPRIQQYYNLTEPQRYGIDATLMYRKGKWDMSFSGNYLKNDIAGRRVGDVNTTINNIFTSFPSEGERSFKRDNYGFRGLISYKFSPKDELSGGFYAGHRTQYRRADIFYNNLKTNLLNNQIVGRSQYFNPNLVLKEGDFNVFNLDYTHSFNKNSTITVSGLYEKADLSGFTSNQNLNINNFRDTLQYTINTGGTPLDAIRLKVDFEQTIGIGKLTTGYQFRNQEQAGEFLYQSKKGNFEPFVIDPAFSANISVLNRIHALYAQYAGKTKRLEFSAGLRYENALREFRASQFGGLKSIPNVLKLSNLFPSANILVDLGKEYRAKLAYSRRVQRSTNNELNPYPEREHSETLEQGDPNIRPEFIGIYELGVTKDFSKGSIYWNVYSQQINDIVNRVNSVYNDTILNRIYTNAGNAALWGSEFGLTYSPLKKVKVFVGGNVYNLNIKGNLFNNQVAVNSQGWVYSINSNISWQMSKTLSSQFNLSYLSARNTAQGEDSRFYLPNLSLKKTFLNNKFTATAQWQNIALGNMQTNQQRITTFGKDFFTTTNYIQETNIIMLNFSYSFNQSNRKAKLPNSEFGEREY
jgi:ferric enterobactin receptor